MKLLVIGHSVEDHLLSADSEQINPGGIYYTASALNIFKDKSDDIALLTSVEKDNYSLFSQVYNCFDKMFFQTVDSIPKVFLKIHNNAERDECYNRITGNLNINVPDINSFDGILINMITGFDISLEQLVQIRNSFKGLIYFDVHTFSRGLQKDGKRNFRPIPEFYRWAGMLDIIQANQNELLTLSSKPEPLEIVKDILSSGAKYFILTMENLGARIYFLKEGELNSVFKPAIKVNVNNKIGCGDVFGAIFFYTYFKYKDINRSLELANVAAGYSASYKNLKDLEKLKEDVLTGNN